MDTSKPRSESSDSPKKGLPHMNVARQLKSSNPRGFGSSSPTSPLTNSARIPKERAPKIPDRKSPRSPLIPEKRRPNRVAEFETQISELQEDLKKLKKELIASKTSKEEHESIAKDLQQQLAELKDRAIESQLDIIQRQQSVDALTLASAFNEIQILKKQLEMVTKCEDDEPEVQGLKVSLGDTLFVMENTKTELECCKESEALAQGLVKERLVQLEEANQTVNALRNEGMKAMGDYDSVASELEDSKARIAILEGIVNKLQSHESEMVSEDHQKDVDELMNLRSEVGRLKATLEEQKTNLMEKETVLEAPCKVGIWEILLKLPCF